MVLYNLSILCLASHLISKSPLLCNHFSPLSRHISIQNSNFQKYVRPIYYSFKSNTKFTISSSNIQNFLDQAIHVDQSFEYNNQQILSQISTVKNPFEPIYVKKCNFVMIHSLFSSGGAILSFSSLTVVDSLFSKCSTIRFGGAIASYSELSLDNVDIQNCKALSTASVFSDSFHKVKVIFKGVSSVRCSSTMSNGAITIRSSTNFSFSYSNLSYCSNEGFYCGIWVDKSYVDVNYSYFSHNTLPDINAGIASMFTRKIVVDHTMFIDLKLKAPNAYGSVSIYIDSNRCKDSTVTNCVFHYPDTLSPSVHTRTGFPVFIDGCCFLNPKSSEKRGALSSFGSNNVFESECKSIKLKQNKPIADIISHKYNNLNIPNNKDYFIFKDKFHFLYFISPLLFAIVFSILFLIF